MINKKRGIIFTITAIVLSAIIIFAFSTSAEYRLKDKMDVVESRIVSMNNFIIDINEDLKKGVFISSFRSLMSMTQYAASNGTFIEEINPTFKELFLNGTLDSQDMSLMEDSTFLDWVDKIELQAEKIDIITNISVIEVSVEHESPWYVVVNANVNMIVQDKRGTSSWDFNKDIKTNVSILSLEDPLYLINSFGKITNTIRVSPFEQFVVGTNAENLRANINESYYISSNMSPSFLMRLEGNLYNSTFGIESLVNVQEFLDQGIPTNDKSSVDYIYFGNQSSDDSKINKTPSWFRLDLEHIEIYDAEGLNCTTPICEFST